MKILTSHRDGFTLVELLIVLAMLGILLAIAVPRVGGLIERAQITADQASLRTLNTATDIYAIDKDNAADDILAGFGTDKERMEELVDKGLLRTIAKPQRKGAAFLWHIDSQEWLYSIFVVVDDPLSHYVFADMLKSDFIFNSWGGGGGSSWSINEQGLFVTGSINNDLLFIGNDRSEYTLTTHFRLSKNPDAIGGLGVFFETVLNGDNANRDTGYILQFDRGYSEIVIRKRLEGNESSSQGGEILARIGNRSTSTIKNENIPISTDSEWWEAEKELSITIQESGTPGIKLLTVSLDGEILLSNFEIDSDIQAANNHTGFRAWNSSPATIYDLTIE